MRYALAILALAMACNSTEQTAPAPNFMETKVYAGSAAGRDFAVNFTTNRTGNITVVADWEPRGELYVLEVLADGNPPPVCIVYQASGQTLGHYVCEVANAPAGNYTARFRRGIGAGKVPVALTITAETD